uniref:uncharacterized protein n=1 Tax=Myxine glutinosa TaxID=7769 RepID=UPI00358DE632
MPPPFKQPRNRSCGKHKVSSVVDELPSIQTPVKKTVQEDGDQLHEHSLRSRPQSSQQQGKQHRHAEQVIRTTVEKPSCRMQLRSCSRKNTSHDQNSTRIISDRLEMKPQPITQDLNETPLQTTPLQTTLRVMPLESGPSFRIPETLTSTFLETSAPSPACASSCTVRLIGKNRTAKDVTELDVLLTRMEDDFAEYRKSLDDDASALIEDVLNTLERVFSKAIAKDSEMKLIKSQLHRAEAELQRDRKLLSRLQQEHISDLQCLEKIQGELKVMNDSVARISISQYLSGFASFVHDEAANFPSPPTKKSKTSSKRKNKR